MLSGIIGVVNNLLLLLILTIDLKTIVITFGMNIVEMLLIMKIIDFQNPENVQIIFTVSVVQTCVSIARRIALSVNKTLTTVYPLMMNYLSFLMDNVS